MFLDFSDFYQTLECSCGEGKRKHKHVEKCNNQVVLNVGQENLPSFVLISLSYQTFDAKGAFKIAAADLRSTFDPSNG